MTKIKIVGIFIFILSIALAFLSIHISNENRVNSKLLDTTNAQKAFTQEISKNIFYIYKNKDASTQQLDDSIKKFLHNLDNKDKILNPINSTAIKNKSEEIIVLWNKFYLSVQSFRDKSKTVSTYSGIILQKIVNDIYTTNLELVVQFNKLIELHSIYFKDTLQTYRNIQYTLFFILVFLLIYLFTQLKDLLSFMQKFLSTSKNIITNSSIKELEPIKTNNNSGEILQATNNFNFLVDKINTSVKYASNSIEHTYQSLEHVENNIEDLLELLSVMDDSENIDKELTKKEDALIQSLEELTSSTLKLQDLKKDLDNLISHHKSKNS